MKCAMLSRTAAAASGVPTRVSISSSSAGSDTGRAVDGDRLTDDRLAQRADLRGCAGS